MAFGMFFFYEVKENYDVTDDNSDQAHDPKECHKAKRRTHYKERANGSDQAIRNGCKNYERLDGVLELKDQRQEDHSYGNSHDHKKVFESFNLIFFFAADF